MSDSAGGVTYPRRLEAVVAERLREEPVVVLTGARTVGKSTLLRAIARAHDVPIFDLDDPDARRLAEADPNAFVTGKEPVCIDEFQHALVLLDAIKAQLNRGLRPGRYLLTGSTRYATLPAASQSLTGRAHVMTIWPLSQGEIRGHRETFLESLLVDPASLVRPGLSTTTRQEYERAVLVGGLPIAVTRPNARSRSRWFGDFVDLVVERDVLDIRRVRQRAVLPRVLQRLASQTAQLVNAAAVGASLGLERETAGDFIQLLESVFLVHRLGAYGRTLSSRVNHAPKVHLVDSGLAAHLLGITEARLGARQPTTLTEFGHVAETFAVNELLKQASWLDERPSFSHFRTRDGAEVDLVVETNDGRVVGVEVKSAGQVGDADFRGLRFLRDRLGEDFLGGVVLYLGPGAYTKEDRLHVLPLDRLWT